jgi:hypothetical protein
MSNSEQERFRKNKPLFWIVVAFTILPDIDIFFGFHRALSHSIIIPTALVIVGTLIYYYYNYFSNKGTLNDVNKNNNEKKSFWGRCMSYGGILWLLHILLDLDLPLAIFFPLSDRLYTLNFAILIDMMPWLIFPVMIVGFVLELTGISYLKGISLYFVNLTPSQRIDIWGEEPVALTIDDLFLHVILFVIFLIFVVRPMLPDFRVERISIWRKKLHSDKSIMSVGIILTVLGILLGPMTGTHTVDSNSITGNFQVSSTTLSPVIAITFESTNYLLQPNTEYFTKGTLVMSSDASPFDHLLLLATRDSYNSFSNSVSELFRLHPLNTSDNILQFELNYQSLLNNFSSGSISVNSTLINETSLETQLNSGSYALVGVIHNWNSTKVLNGTYLMEQAQLEVTIKSSRFSLLSIGIISLISGILIMYLSIKIKKN